MVGVAKDPASRSVANDSQPDRGMACDRTNGERSEDIHLDDFAPAATSDGACPIAPHPRRSPSLPARAQLRAASTLAVAPFGIGGFIGFRVNASRMQPNEGTAFAVAGVSIGVFGLTLAQVGGNFWAFGTIAALIGMAVSLVAAANIQG